jgi:hypothetical protein
MAAKFVETSFADEPSALFAPHDIGHPHEDEPLGQSPVDVTTIYPPMSW